ncbi:uncharacterized protein V6R79_004262 [Siganus canaliculatus]
MQNEEALEANSRRDEEEEESGLDWLLGRDSPEVVPAPMDSNVSMSRQSSVADAVDGVYSTTFTRTRVFEAASQGNSAQLQGLLSYLRLNGKRLTSPEFTDETNGKTALLKALLNLKNGENYTIGLLLNIAEKTGDLDALVNAAYKDPYYRGQTALHVAIERRSFEHVKLLVQKGADVQAKANGKFFQYNAGLGFYFGELPLSLAACTNQPNIVSFLMDNSYRRADAADRDSQGNTVLHTLVVIADNTPENTDMISRMYDEILIQHNRLDETGVELEAVENSRGLTPLKLAAKLGKIGIFRHILHREFTDESMRPLSRKLTEWVYGPVHSSLYDTSSIDTTEDNSVLDILAYGGEIPNRPEMLQIEPLRSLLEDKWDRFAAKLFLVDFLCYLVYLLIFTTVAFYRKEGQPPFPIEDVPLDYLRCCGELVSVFGAVWFLYKELYIFKRNPPNFRGLYTDGFCNILFFLQAVLLLLSAALYCCGCTEYIGFLVLSLALAWINVLYYSRGSRQMGMYSVMMQRMIIGDLFHFLCVYAVLLFGFSAAIVALIDDSFPHPNTTSRKLSLNATQLLLGKSVSAEAFKCKKPSYSDFRFTTLELFKFTIGMGDLEFTDHVQFKEVFYVLLILYIVLTYILLLNMLIALMGNTVEKISKESENIWKLQRAFTILDTERTLPQWLQNKLFSRSSKTVSLGSEKERRCFFRVEEMKWSQWRSDLGYVQEEDPGDRIMFEQSPGNRWSLNPLWERIRVRRHQQQHQHLSTNL